MSIAAKPTREQTRARYPDEEGYVECDGVRVFWESYGDGPTTFLLFPTSPISQSRLWKAQIPYLARGHRLLTFDPRGNGRSDRPTDPAAYSYWEYVEDGRALLEAAGVDNAILVGLCDGGGWAVMLASTHPETALGVVALAPCLPYLTPSHQNYTRYPFTEPLDTDEGWAKYNIHYWRRDFRGFLEFFFSQQLPEPHSTKQIEDCVEWGLGTDPETLALADEEAPLPWGSVEEARAVCERVSCPVLVIHGDLDQCQPRERAEAVASLTGGALVALEGVGHLPQARHPVKVNLLIRDFAESVERRTSWSS
jgi:pimeloyl-ACP methyl ester carboxylesterase